MLPGILLVENPEDDAQVPQPRNVGCLHEHNRDAIHHLDDAHGKITSEGSAIGSVSPPVPQLIYQPPLTLIVCPVT